MSEFETVLGLLVAVVVLATVARRLGVPYPILVVLGGLALAAVPGLKSVELAPDIVFVVFVPPLVYSTAWLTSLRDVRANVRPISLLAVWLLLLTIVAVAAVAHAADGSLPWSAAFVLGALVAPTDVVAASAIAARLGLPQRLMTVLEGEGMVDDATGLVAYRMAVAAVLTGSFSIWQAGLQLLVISLGGIAIGFVVAWLLARIWEHLDDPPVEITLSLLAPFVAYLPAEALGLSGVVAVATAGLYAGWRAPELLSADTRVKASAVWEVVVFLLNGLIFVLVGLQLRSLDVVLAERPAATFALVAALVCLTVIVVRLVWVFPATYLPRWLSRDLRERDRAPPWQVVAILGWTGMRGGDSMAAALAIPFTVVGGAPFPGRDLIIALTFCVILVTLVLQGLSLPVLIRRLGVSADQTAQREEDQARLAAAQAALDRLDDLAGKEGANAELLSRLRSRYSHLAGDLAHETEPDDEARHAAGRRIQLELIEAQRRAVIELRNRGVIGDEALRQVQRDLDLDELRLAQDDAQTQPQPET
jgi:Na+/H+ antiporter